MGKRTGGIAKPGHRKKSLKDCDVFFVPEVADEAINHLSVHLPLYKYPNVNLSVLDACANDGVLGKAIKKWYLKSGMGNAKVIFQDIKQKGISILDYVPKKKFDVIICNPPWKEKLARDIYFWLMRHLDETGVLLFVINNSFLYQGWERARSLGCQKFYFLPRFAFAKAGIPLTDGGVAVYHAGPVPRRSIENPVYIDIPPEVAKPGKVRKKKTKK